MRALKGVRAEHSEDDAVEIITKDPILINIMKKLQKYLKSKKNTIFMASWVGT